MIPNYIVIFRYNYRGGGTLSGLVSPGIKSESREWRDLICSGDSFEKSAVMIV